MHINIFLSVSVYNELMIAESFIFLKLDMLEYLKKTIIMKVWLFKSFPWLYFHMIVDGQIILIS